MHQFFSITLLFRIVAITSAMVLGTLNVAYTQDRAELQYAPSVVANPLKGLVPYSGKKDQFPHTMEFNYIGLSQLMRGYESFEWQPLEQLLDDIASRGHQAVVRIYLEYPGKKNVIPQFLVEDGLIVHKYLNNNTQPFPPAEIETPDYENAKLRRALKSFINAFGKKYDGDPRLGFITAGLLGTWGEWHTYPRTELFASKDVQAEVMDAYQSAFKTTRILLRYPAGEKTWGKASNIARPFGYHDDSFAWATLDTGRKEDDWFYMSTLAEAGAKAINKWKTQPIGGEIRPEAWGKVFDENPDDPTIQDFRKCVEETHVSWLMDSGVFSDKSNAQHRKRAETEVRRMGYEFQVIAVTTLATDGDKLAVKIEVQNNGVAPFYYEWPAEIGVIVDGKIVKQFPMKNTITKLLPDAKPREWNEQIDISQLPSDSLKLALRIANSLPQGAPIRFANSTQDLDVDGWLTLCTVMHNTVR